MKRNRKEYKLSTRQAMDLEQFIFHLETNANICRAMYYLHDSPDRMVGLNRSAFDFAFDSTIHFLIDSVSELCGFYNSFINGEQFDLNGG